MNNSQSKREKTELILKNITNLPSVPKIMAEALKALDKDTVSTSELNKVISKDQGLVSKILAIANSPMYGLQRKVTSLDYALLLLGLGELKSIISILSMTEAFKNKTDKFLDQKEFWLHSFLTGSASKKMAEDSGFHNSGEAFIAGFLHDMGITLIHRYFHSSYVQICELASNEKMKMIDAEKEVLGMDHQEIGYYLLERWNFPGGLCTAILNHHTPSSANPEYKLLTTIIHLADYSTNNLKIGNLNCDSFIELDIEPLKILNLSTDTEIMNYINNYKPLLIEQMNSVRY